MEFIYGMVCGSCLLASALSLYLAFYKLKPAATVQKEANEEEQRKAKRMREAFDEMMAYDVATAIRGKKVH